jgi:hypothetical protein
MHVLPLGVTTMGLRGTKIIRGFHDRRHWTGVNPNRKPPVSAKVRVVCVLVCACVEVLTCLRYAWIL